MASQADVRAIDLAIEANQTVSSGESYTEGFISPFDPIGGYTLEGLQTPPFNPQEGLSMWDRFLGAITPESHAESVVNRIYGDMANTLVKDPYYNREDSTSPNVWVAAKGAASSAVSAVTGTVSAFTGFAKYALIGVVAVFLIAVVLYAGVTAYVRK